MKKVLLLLLVLLPGFAFSEPYIALREGLKCSSCHVNRTGGGKRTRMGAGFGATDLPWKKVDLQEKKIPMYWSVLDDLLSVGGDFRFRNISTFEKDNTSNTFDTDKANLYLGVKLIPDTASFYLDESVAPGGAQAREIFGMLEALPAHGWLKAGRFLPPYGLRVEDDKAFIREVTGFNFNNPDLGVEVGFEPGPWTIVTSVTNGTAGSLDNNTSKQVVSSLVYVGNAFRVGGSGSYNSGNAGQKNIGGVFGGIHFGPAVLLQEVDFIHEDPDGAASRDQIVTHSEADIKIHDGWNVKAVYEYYDPNRDVAEDQRDRFQIGVEPFVYPFVQFGVYYTFNESIPQNAAQNADELSVRLHFYF